MNLNLPADFIERVLDALKTARANYTGSANAFAKSVQLKSSTYSQIVNGKTEGILSEQKWLQLGRRLGVSPKKRNWNIVRTEVFAQMEEEMLFCKEFSKSMIFADDSDIGKTTAARRFAMTQQNSFRIDCGQCKTKQLFVRTIAQTVGVDNTGRYADVLADLKYYLQTLHQPLIILDDAGYLDYPAFLTIKELQDATEGYCGWYAIGDDSLIKKINTGIEAKKVGFIATYNRFSAAYQSIVPTDPNERTMFYKKLLNDVLSSNVKNTANIPALLKQCFKAEKGRAGLPGLRRVESVLILNEEVA